MRVRTALVIYIACSCLRCTRQFWRQKSAPNLSRPKQKHCCCVFEWPRRVELLSAVVLSVSTLLILFYIWVWSRPPSAARIRPTIERHSNSVDPLILRSYHSKKLSSNLRPHRFRLWTFDIVNHLHHHPDLHPFIKDNPVAVTEFCVCGLVKIRSATGRIRIGIFYSFLNLCNRFSDQIHLTALDSRAHRHTDGAIYSNVTRR